MCPATRSKAAFTFAEVLLCVYLLAVAVLGVIATLVHCLQAQRGSAQRALATRLAEDVLVGVVSRKRASRDGFLEDHSLGRTRVEEFEYAVTEASVDPDLKQVNVCVYFNDEGAVCQQSLTELVYNSAR
jgi:Tfp pilus assembly protein PilV